MLSNRFIRAFKPKLFEAGGFPTTVQVEDELIRYIDSMHAYSFDTHYNKLCGGITREEFELLKNVLMIFMNLLKRLIVENF